MKLTLIPLLLSLSLLAPAQAESEKAGRFYEDALKRYRAKDLEGADIQLKNALQEDRRFLPALLLLGKVSLESGVAGAAEGAFEEALRLGASRNEVAPLLARALVAQGRHAHMLQLPSLNPEGLSTSSQLALLLVRAAALTDLGDERAAMAAIDQARALNPNDPDTHLAEVPLRIRTGAFAAGLAAAERALRLNPALPDALYQRGAVVHAQGRLDAALSSYNETIARQPEHLEALVARAGVYLDRQQFDKADVDLKTLRKAHPNDPRADYMSALIAERRGDRAAATVSMRRVAELLAPVPLESVRFRPQVLMLGGLSHYALKEPQKALPYLETLIKQQPRNPAAKLLAQILFEQGQVENGIQLLENYLRLQPQDDLALALVAQGHTQAGRSQKAIQLLQQALQTRESADLRGTLGQALMRAGKPTEALQQLETAWKRNPRHVSNGSSLVTLLVQQRQAVRALQVARDLVRDNPNQAALHQLLATAQAAGGDLAGARASLQQVLKLDRFNVEAHFGLARIEAREGRAEAARSRLEAVHRRDENAVDPMLELAQLAGQQGQAAQADRWLEKAVTAAGPRELRPHFAIVNLQLLGAQYTKALESAKLLLAKAPEDPGALLTYARAQMAAGDPKAAWPSLVHVSRRVAQETGPLLEVGEMQYRAGDMVGAAYTLGKALELQPRHPQALVLLASVEIQRRDLAAASRHTEAVLSLEPRTARSHLLAADLAGAKQQPSAALTALRRAHEVQPGRVTAMRLFLQLQVSEPNVAIPMAEGWLKKSPTDRELRRALAEFQTVRGLYAAARANYELLLAQQPNDARSLNNLALLMLRQNQLPAARTQAERALKAAAGTPQVLDTLAWVMHHQGEHDRALGLLRDALLRDPEHGEIRYHLAAVLARLGRAGEARSELQAALAQPGGLESVKEAQALLATLK